MRALRRVGFVLVFALALPQTAFAHANPIRLDPPDGAVVARPPQLVRIYFDQAVHPQTGMRAVRNGGGSVLAGAPYLIGKTELVVPLRPGLARGSYTVLWRALSEDGHTVSGVTTFAVGLGHARPQPALKAPSSDTFGQILERWLFLAGVLVSGGAALFRFAMPRWAEPPAALYLGGFTLAGAGGLLLVNSTSVDTRFGIATACAAGLAALGVLVATLAFRWRRLLPVAAVLGLLLLPTPSLSGHAVDPGRPRVEVLVDLAHLAAAAIWLGGLLSLLLGLRAGKLGEAALRRFSAIAVVSVIILAATGLARAISELTSVAQLWSTHYGLLLVTKTAIFALLLGLGWRNRYRLVPAAARSSVRLQRSVVAEVLLFAGLVTAVAVLTQSRPGRAGLALVTPAAIQPRAAASTGSVVLTQSRRRVELAGAVADAVLVRGRYLLWETVAGEEESPTTLVSRDLRTRQTRVVARGVASQYGVAAPAGRPVFATASSPTRLVLLRRAGRRQILSRALIAPLAWRGNRVAWAEQAGRRQRVVVFDVARGRRWLAADLPACARGRCYRIDRVTLADDGVVFDRGAIGPQPSLVVRRAFSAPRADVMKIEHDPQPDLVPSSAGAIYYALGRGWYRWDFGQAGPRRVLGPAAAISQPVGYENGSWAFTRPARCDGTVATGPSPEHPKVAVSAAQVRTAAGVGRGFCVTPVATSGAGRGLMTTWQVTPRGSHSSDDVTSVVLLPHSP
jgi:copper transport protein